MHIIYLLGLYTARLELFRLFFFMVFGAFIWSCYLIYEASGSSTRKKKKKKALILTVFFGVVLIGLAITWLLSKTNFGWWFDR
jgi:small neutral amino acid transporter SnatA (MarC family)